MDNAFTVLVVDDEPPIRRFLRTSLTAAGHRVVMAGNAGDALAMMAAEKPDVIILDLGLPDRSGFEVITEIRKASPVPIIVLSARNDERSKVEALDIGADDYIGKPFGMAAAQSQRAALFGFSEGGAMSMLFAATYPQRVRALIVYGSRSGHLPLPQNWLRDRIAQIERGWGSGEIFGRSARSKASDETLRRSFARWERAGASPAAMTQLTRMNAETDIRHILPAIHTPTLILHRIGDELLSVEQGRYLADHIPGAKFIELPGTDHFPFYDYDLADRMADEAEEFLTGARSEGEPDRVLATVLIHRHRRVDETRRRTRRPAVARVARPARRGRTNANWAVSRP